MINIQIKTNYKDVKKTYANAPDKIIKPALSKAINDALKIGIKDFARSAAKGTEVSSYLIKKAIKITKSNQRTLTGTLQATGKPIPIKAYRPRKTASGVRVKMQGKHWTFEPAFRVKKFGNHWFVRNKDERTPYATSRRSKGTGSRKDPRAIRQLKGPPLADNIAQSVIESIAASANKIVSDRMDYWVNRDLKNHFRKINKVVK